MLLEYKYSVNSAMQPRRRIEEPADSGHETSASETSLDEEELDEVEELLQEEQLRQKYRQQIAEAKNQHYTAAFLRKFVEAEAVQSAQVTGIAVVRCRTASLPCPSCLGMARPPFFLLLDSVSFTTCL